MNSSLQIDFTPKATSSVKEDSNWVKLQQYEYLEVDQILNFQDIYQMLLNAQAGLSAFSYLLPNCPLTITENGVIITLDFYVFPSSMNLGYSLSPSIGELGIEGIQTSLHKDFDLIFPLSDRVELDYIIEDLNPIWLAGPRTAKNQVISPIPTLTIDNTIVTSSKSMFAVLRAKGQAPCFLHTLRIEIEKFKDVEQDDGSTVREIQKIDELKPTITATWTKSDGSTGTTILELKIPKCVEDFLTWCPNGTLKGFTTITGTNRTITVYYNSCTGNYIYWKL